MDSAAYQRWLDRLLDTARDDPTIVGLVALGSTADVSRQPDQWSDHDVWIVTREGAAAGLRDDPSWLPDADRIVGHFTETKHGRSVIYEDGHLVEIAVFDDPELEVARANDYRVLYDAGGIAGRLAAIAAATVGERAGSSAEHLAGRFVTRLVIGLGRYGRGELLSANQLIRELAVADLLEMVACTVPRPHADLLDNLDPRRRFELAYPELAGPINQSLMRSPVELAQVLLDTARSLESSDIPALRPDVLTAVQRAIDRARAGRPPPERLHHVQLAMPAGAQDSARRYYRDVLGLEEPAKPAALAGRAGCWFRGPALEIHLGVEEPFRAASTAHPGIQVGDIDSLADKLVASGYGVEWNEAIPGYRRFHSNDPFGNRLEFLQPG